MTAIRIEKFMGMAPKISNRLLPDTAAETANNCRLLSGELRGLLNPARLHTFASGTNRTAYRLYKDDGTAVWMGFSDADVDVVKGPLINDAYNRHYWTGDAAYPEYNSDTRIEANDPSYKLGMPEPTGAMTVGTTGGTGSNETRAYAYTFVNEWGEESAPSPVTSFDGPEDATWDLSDMDVVAPDQVNRNPATDKRIYRTVTGQASVAYYYVAEIPLGTATYSDTSTNATVVLNNTLQSFTWNTPPDDLEGLLVHPGGFLVGFVGKDLYMSVRYRPHAWPVAYILSVEHNIVGLAIYNNMLAVMTEGHPYFFAGNRPENLTPIKSPSAEPCLSKASIAATIQGVLYASPNGLVLFNESGPSVVTNQIISTEEWNSYTPTAMRGAQFGEQYLAFYSSLKGIRIAPAEPLAAFSLIDQFEAVDDVVTDHTTGEAWLIRNNIVYQWEPPSGTPLSYTWLSKVYDFTRPINFGAYMVKHTALTIEQSDEDATLYETYNTNRFSADPPDALMPINFVPLNGKRTTSVDVGTTPVGIDEIVQNKYPIGGSPLYDLDFLSASREGEVTVTIWANGRQILSRVADSGVMYRMPAGFKAATWQVQLTGNADVYSFAMAETPRGLSNV